MMVKEPKQIGKNSAGNKTVRGGQATVKKPQRAPVEVVQRIDGAQAGGGGKRRPAEKTRGGRTRARQTDQKAETGVDARCQSGKPEGQDDGRKMRAQNPHTETEDGQPKTRREAGRKNYGRRQK